MKESPHEINGPHPRGYLTPSMSLSQHQLLLGASFAPPQHSTSMSKREECANRTMEYRGPIGESVLASNVKTEPDEMVLYGCHICRGLAFDNYDDLTEHLDKHLDNDDIIDVKQECDSDTAESNFDLATDDDSYIPGSEEESDGGEGYNEHLWEYAIQSEEDSKNAKILQDNPGMKATDPETLNLEFSLESKPGSPVNCIERTEDEEVHKGKTREVTVTEEKEFKCDVCNKRFERKHSLVIHLRVHTGERPYKCNECGASYKQSGDLTMHLRTHVGLKPYSCDVCSAKFLRRGDINRHMIIHSKEKPFKCEACGRNYTRSYHLKLHWQNKHTEKEVWHGKDIRTGEKVKGKIKKQEKRYECDSCKKTFKDRRNLKVHTQLHTGYKPFTCKVCKKSFAHSGSFNIHKRIHTGEKPYVCKICNERFNCSSAVGKHRRRVHEK